VREWVKGVYPLRLKQGFKIDGAWTIKENNQFVWILRYDGPDNWKAKQDAYYDSAERKALTPDPAQYITRAEEYFISPVEKG
jgi:hypothetical protein